MSRWWVPIVARCADAELTVQDATSAEITLGLARVVWGSRGIIGDGFPPIDGADGSLVDLERYRLPRSGFWVIESLGHAIAGGGIAPLRHADPDVCEFQRLFFFAPRDPEHPIGRSVNALMESLISNARARGYQRAYVESTSREPGSEFNRVLERNGFKALDAPWGDTGYSGFDAWYARAL